MKVTINSLSDKKVKFKIYDYNGKRRKLLKKGKFLRKTEAEITPLHSEIVVSISRHVSPLSFLYAWFLNVLVYIADLYFSNSKLNYLFEILIINLKEDDEVNVVYTNATPERGVVYDRDKKLGEPDALYCTTHHSKKYITFFNRHVWLEGVIYMMSAVAIIAAICLIYFKCIGAY